MDTVERLGLKPDFMVVIHYEVLLLWHLLQGHNEPAYVISSDSHALSQMVVPTRLNYLAHLWLQ